MKSLSLKDTLTGLYNRRYLIKKIEELQNLYNREGLKFALAIIDLDNFKRVNDNYGHNIGDEVLIDFSKSLQESVREVDIVGRYGGEEFLIILIGDDLFKAEKMISRFRETLKNTSLSTEKIKITFSSGISFSNEFEHIDYITDLIGKADARLYTAKASGKDRIIVE